MLPLVLLLTSTLAMVFNWVACVSFGRVYRRWPSGYWTLVAQVLQERP
jgi:hypothetical protein